MHWQTNLRGFLLAACIAWPISAQNVANGVNIKINFTPPRTAPEPDNKYYNAAKEYMDWILEHRNPNGRFPLNPSFAAENRCAERSRGDVPSGAEG